MSELSNIGYKLNPTKPCQCILIQKKAILKIKRTYIIIIYFTLKVNVKEISNHKLTYICIYTRCIKNIVGFYNVPDTDTDINL